MKTCLSRKILSFALILLVLLALCACTSEVPAKPEGSDIDAQGAQSGQIGMDNAPRSPEPAKPSETAKGIKAPDGKKQAAAKTDGTAANKGAGLEKGAAEKTAAAMDGDPVTAELQKPSKDEEPTVHLFIVYPKEANLSDVSSNCAFSEGESVLDILVRYGRENKIAVVFSGPKSNGYVEGINGVFEFDYGAESGWLYEVNGVMPKMSAGAYKPKDKDTVIWRYSYSLSGVEK